MSALNTQSFCLVPAPMSCNQAPVWLFKTISLKAFIRNDERNNVGTYGGRKFYFTFGSCKTQEFSCYCRWMRTTRSCELRNSFPG